MDLAELTLATFEPLVGDPFTLGERPDAIELVLESATTCGDGAGGDREGGRDPFSLVFRGPFEPLLPQAIYALAHAAVGVLEVFVVPIARDGEHARYEAVFA